MLIKTSLAHIKLSYVARATPPLVSTQKNGQLTLSQRQSCFPLPWQEGQQRRGPRRQSWWRRKSPGPILQCSLVPSMSRVYPQTCWVVYQADHWTTERQVWDCVCELWQRWGLFWLVFWWNAMAGITLQCKRTQGRYQYLTIQCVGKSCKVFRLWVTIIICCQIHSWGCAGKIKFILWPLFMVWVGSFLIFIHCYLDDKP